MVLVTEDVTSKKSSISTRIISGTIGAVVTSLVVTPFEVVKVLTQAAPPAAVVSSHTTTPSRTKNLVPCPKGCGTFILYNGHADCVLSKSSVPYFNKETGKALKEGIRHEICQATTSSSSRMAGVKYDRPLGTIAMLQRIYAQKGLQGIYAGLRPTLIMAAPNTILYYAAYEEIVWQMRQSIQQQQQHQRHYSSSSNNNNNNNNNNRSFLERNGNWLFPLLAGGSARLISSTVTAPLEFLRTRQAAAVGNGGLRDRSTVGIATQRNGSLYHELRTIIRTEGGVGTLFRGLRPTLWRDVPFSAIYWLLLEQFRSYWEVIRLQGTPMTPLEQSGEAFLNGAIAGMIAAACTTPFDVAKTRQQTLLLAPKVVAVTMGTPAAITCTEIQNGALICKHFPCSTGISDVVSSSTASNGGTFHQLRLIVQTEGMAALWRGNQARMLKVAPSCAIMLSSYELGKRLLE